MAPLSGGQPEAAVTPNRGRGDETDRRTPSMGLLSYLRGDDLRDAGVGGEQRSLPRPDNELPLLGAYTASTVTPTAALAIADVWAAVRVLADAASSFPLHVY